MSRLPSWLLVALQFALIAALVLTTRPPGTAAANAIAIALLVAGSAVGIAALRANPPSNFNIRPELKSGARLVTSGPYRHVRHPIYLSLLTVTVAGVAADPRAWRIALWLALLAVLLAKLVREERYVRAAFPEYADYAARTWRLIPGVY